MTDDPYSVLGVARGTPVADVKRAYRRLAKENHPDSAGPQALARFLAIQAAYEEIVEGKLRPRDLGGAGRAGGAGSGGGPAWRADPERARATRESWRRRSSRPAGAGGTSSGAGGTSSGSRTGSGTGAGDRSGSGSRADGATGGASSGTGASGGADAGAGDARSRRSRDRQAKNRAKPGSTTYDGADREPFDPEWGGASWYGPSSGTYWTINPKEYADPRKHGPEYQARARRSTEPAARAPEAVGGVDEDLAPDDESPAPDPAPTDERERAARGRAGEPDRAGAGAA